MDLESDMDELPETQTQEDYIESSQVVQVRRCWGRLCSCLQTMDSVDLYENSYTFGRAPSCNILVEQCHFPSILNVSKEHFTVCKDSDDIVYITDLSKNGTFVNNVKVGKNNRHILHDDDKIAIGHPNARVFSFSCNISYDDCDYPYDMRKKYFISKSIGCGAFGEIRLAHDKRTFRKFAIKKINKASSNSDNKGHQKIKTEIEILSSLTHAFIIQMIEVFETNKVVYIVLEYMQGGELTTKIKSSAPFPEPEVKFVFYQILLAVRYLHLNGVTHRDLKPENVLLLSNNPYPIVKVSDFGLSKIIEDVSLMETMCGTVQYAAPEVLHCCEPYRKNVDVWSMGVILFYMLSKAQPFTGSDRADMVRKIIAGKIEWDYKSWKNISSHAKDLTRRMLVVNRDRRISIPEIFRHTWIEKDPLMRSQVEKYMIQTFEESSDTSEEVLSAPKRMRLSRTEESSL